MTCHSQSRVYQLSYIVNIRTGPGPVLSLFGLKDRRTGPFKKARTVDTLLKSTVYSAEDILQLQEQSRAKLLVLADVIVPGHGPKFKVPQHIKLK